MHKIDVDAAVSQARGKSPYVLEGTWNEAAAREMLRRVGGRSRMNLASEEQEIRFLAACLDQAYVRGTDYDTREHSQRET